jgi:hypothetical protein
MKDEKGKRKEAKEDMTHKANKQVQQPHTYP